MLFFFLTALLIWSLKITSHHHLYHYLSPEAFITCFLSFDGYGTTKRSMNVEINSFQLLLMEITVQLLYPILSFINTCHDFTLFPDTTLNGSFSQICEAKAWSANWCSGSLVCIVGGKKLWQSWLVCKWFEEALSTKYFSNHPWSLEGALSYPSQSTLVSKYLTCFPRTCYESRCIWKESGKAGDSVPYTWILHNTGQTMDDSRSPRDTIFLHNLMQSLEIIEKINPDSRYKLGYPLLHKLACVVIVWSIQFLYTQGSVSEFLFLSEQWPEQKLPSVSSRQEPAAWGFGPGPAGTSLQKCLSQF